MKKTTHRPDPLLIVSGALGGVLLGGPALVGLVLLADRAFMRRNAETMRKLGVQ